MNGQLDKKSKEYKLQQEWLKKNKITQCPTSKGTKGQTGSKMAPIEARGGNRW